MHETLTGACLDALYLALWLSLPGLAVALAISLWASFMQSLTQLTDPALTAIPRALAVGLTLALCGVWMGTELTGFTERILKALPHLAH